MGLCPRSDFFLSLSCIFVLKFSLLFLLLLCLPFFSLYFLLICHLLCYIFFLGIPEHLLIIILETLTFWTCGRNWVTVNISQVEVLCQKLWGKCYFRSFPLHWYIPLNILLVFHCIGDTVFKTNSHWVLWFSCFVVLAYNCSTQGVRAG